MRKELAVAGFIVGQAQSAGQLVLRGRQRRLNARQLVSVQQFVRHARLAQHLDIFTGAVELLLSAEQLQRAALPSFIGDAGLFAQRLQAVAAVFGDAHHAAFILLIVLHVAVAQHVPHPFQLKAAAVQADSQRRMTLEHPFNRLQRHARRGPGRRVTGRYLTRVACAGLQRSIGLAIQHRHLMARARQIPGARHANHTTTENHYVHIAPTGKFKSIIH